MENILENSDASGISKKSRSLDIQSLYVEKSRVSVGKGGAEGRVLKRKRPELGLGHGKKKRKSRKEVSLSSFEPVDKKSRKNSNAVGSSGLNLGSPDLNSPALKLSQLVLHQKRKNVQVLGDGSLHNLCSFNSISHSLDHNIPKRPRGFLRRKKFQSNHISEQAGTSSSQINSDTEAINLTGDSGTPVFSSEGKQKKVFDEFKENSSSRTNSAHCSKAKNGASVRYSVDPTLKRAQTNRGKRRESASQKQNPADEVEFLVNDSTKVCEGLQEDDEENLEQNAARMLSSRFDPSCTGFSANSKAYSTSQSMNGLLLMPSFHQDFETSGSIHSAGSEFISTDAAGRLLRPRKQHKEKGFVRRRRHFYEIFSRDLDAYWVLNQRIKVFWPLDQSWYFGLVIGYDPERKLHHVKYDDRDEEWINLQNERFKLLLLPDEVPGKSGSEKSGLCGQNIEEQDEDINAKDHNFIGSYMDSEPIISWLARSTRRVKSSPLGIVKKQKTSCQSKNLVQSILFGDSVSRPQGCLGVDPSGKGTDKLYSNSVLPDRPANGEISENSMMQRTVCSKDRRLPFVYFRRRFRNRGQGLKCISQESSGCRSLSGSAAFLDLERVEALGENDVAPQGSGLKDLTDLDWDSLLWSGENFGLLNLTVSWMKLKQVRLKLSFPLQLIHNYIFDADIFWLCHTLMMLQYGTVTTVWPKVQLEILFVDNVVGLRFMLFEGCLMQVVAFVCLILTAFHQPNEHGKFVDVQLPITSIRFKLSGFCDLGKRFVFVVYNFLEVKNSTWLYLDGKLKQHCSVTKQLPLTECTYDNIMALQNGSDQLPVLSVSEEPVSSEGLHTRSWQGIMHKGMSKQSACIDMSRSSSNSDEKHWRLPSFVLSFSAAPTFFLSLHLKLLMENNVASMSFQNRNLLSLPEGSEDGGSLMGGDCPPVEDFSNRSSESAVKNNVESALRDAASSGWLSCAKSKVETDALPIGNDGDMIKISQKYLNRELNVTGTSVGPQGSGKEIDGTVGLQRHPCQHSVSEKCAGRSWPSVSEVHSFPDKSESGCLSCLNGISVDMGTENAQQSTSDLVWNMNDFSIRSPNPTAPRSVWRRNRHSLGSSSFGYRSKLWPDGGATFIQNGFGNGSRKPRTQVSYLLPVGGDDFGSKPRSHYWKGRPYKRIRNDNEKMTSVGSRSPPRHPELLSCDANVLITVGDRGWRECGGQVVLEFVDHKDWRLLVKLLGATKYSFKADQFLQAGTANRYTHAMMWKGEKDWILEFPDRSQWTLFREMHEECYSRNIRAASVKNIPIPGVRRIEEGDDNAVEVPYVCSSPKYFRQIETEVEMALDPSRVLYDMESDDEDWISKYRTSFDINGNNLLEISEEMFGKTMDMFEKVAYAQQREDFTGDEIEELMVGVGPIDVIKAIYEHWQQKRQRKGMPLIRQFQPPLWEIYQQQLKEWELAMNKTNNYINGYKERVVMMEKPPMFAFCLRPRGLEVPNKGPKQRSQRKLMAGGHYNAFSRDQDGLRVFGRKSTGFAFGEERAVFAGQNHESSDASPWLQTSTRVLSPRDALSTGYLSMSSDGSERNQHPKLHRKKSKVGTFLFPSESQMMATSYNQRMTDSQMMATSYNQRMAGKRNGACRWNMGLPEWPTQKQHQLEGYQRHKVELLDNSDVDEFRLRDASGAAQHASNMAKLKREKAQRLLYRADLAIHKAVVALMTAEAIKASSEDSTDDG